MLSVNEDSTALLVQTDHLHALQEHLTIIQDRCITQAAWDALLESSVIQQHKLFLQVH